VPDQELFAEKQAYQDASRSFDLFVSGLAAALLITAVVLFAPDGGLSPANMLELAAIVFFALALIASLRKVEQTLMVLGTSYTILETEREAGAKGGQPAAGAIRELGQAVQVVSLRAARAHRVRSWLLGLGVFCFVAARVFSDLV
jgi:hypothetical protein